MKKFVLSLLAGLALVIAGMTLGHATVSNGTNQVVYNGDGVTSTFPFSFNVYNSGTENDLVLQEENTTTGAITNLTLNTDYSVSLNGSIPSNGSVTLTAGALSVGTSLSILRQLPLTQLVKEADNSPTPAAVRNNVYDRNIMISQQLQTQLTRAVLQSIFASTSITLPAAVANYFLCWDSTGTNIANCAQLAGTIAVPIANSNLQTLTASNLVNGSSLFGSGTMTSFATTGNIGIGTPAPTGGRLIVSGGNVGIGTITPGKSLDVVGTVRAIAFNGLGSTLTFPSNSFASTGINWTTVYNYGTSENAFTSSSNLKVAYGTMDNTSVTITNLPFTGSGTYSILMYPNTATPSDCTYTNISGASASISCSVVASWIAIGY